VAAPIAATATDHRRRRQSSLPIAVAASHRRRQ